MSAPCCRAAAMVAGILVLLLPASSPADEAKDILIVETILRLDDFDLGGSDKAQAAVGRYLKSHWAGERYLDLIRRFSLKEEAPGVLRLALEQADAPIGVEATSLLVELGAGGLLGKALHGEDAGAAVRAAKAIAHTDDPTLLAELPKVLAEASRSPALRSAALGALYRKDADKHPELLAQVKDGELQDDLRQTASEILLLSRDPKVREKAKALFAVGKGEFPPVSELLKRSGNAKAGRKLFGTKTCIVCHQAEGAGINFGPGLSEIGDKLNKATLYQAIIEPSAGISMGFEGWEITMRDGAQLVGIVQELEEALTVTMIGGSKHTMLKSDVAAKKMLKQSLMYPGLHRLMTPEELVDLVEYLSTLKKASGGS